MGDDFHNYNHEHKELAGGNDNQDQGGGIIVTATNPENNQV